MKLTLSTSQAADIIRSAGFSYNAARALAEYYEQLEYDTGTGDEIECDGVAIRSDWSEYGSFVDWYKDTQCDSLENDDEDEAEAEAGHCAKKLNVEYIKFRGGILVATN